MTLYPIRNIAKQTITGVSSARTDKIKINGRLVYIRKFGERITVITPLFLVGMRP